MANHEMPRRGGAAHAALITLHGIGGCVYVHAWKRVISWKGTHTQFASNVIESLLRAQLIELLNSHTALPQVKVTGVGLARLGVGVVREVEAPRAPVGAPYVGPDRALNVKKLRPEHLARPGSFDYRNIPSRMGAERVPFKTGLVLDGDAAR